MLKVILLYSTQNLDPLSALRRTLRSILLLLGGLRGTREERARGEHKLPHLIIDVFRNISALPNKKKKNQKLLEESIERWGSDESIKSIREVILYYRL